MELIERWHIIITITFQAKLKVIIQFITIILYLITYILPTGRGSPVAKLA